MYTKLAMKYMFCHNGYLNIFTYDTQPLMTMAILIKIER